MKHLSSGPSEVAANLKIDGKLDKNLQLQPQLVQSESFAPSFKLLPHDVTQTELKNDAGIAGQWSIQANRFGFEPRVTQFNFNAIEKSKLGALEALKESGRQHVASDQKEKSTEAS